MMFSTVSMCTDEQGMLIFPIVFYDRNCAILYGYCWSHNVLIENILWELTVG